MTSAELRAALLAGALALATGCGATAGGTTSTTSGGSGDSGTGGSSGTATSGATLTVSVNGSSCSATYLDKPCVAVTICTPGTSTCQTIPDVLLDTGSYGLRVFSSLVGLALPAVASGSGALGECVQFADGSAQWGPVVTAAVVLGDAAAVTVPIQLVDAAWGRVPASCGTPETSPSSAGFNGILGVGPFVEDCGATCAASSGAGLYWRCTSAGCTATAAPLASQVQNPVAALPDDGNGVVVSLPAVAAGGAASASGTLGIGIGTGTGTPTAGTVLALDAYGEFATELSGASYRAFVDTGSNGLFFTPPSSSPITACSASYAPWFCPSSTRAFTATVSSGAASAAIDFQLGNFVSLWRSGNAVFSEIGGDAFGGGTFDWGLPFFLGRDVYVGIEGRASPLGTGPYVAF
ncbi:MAG: DUF3443 family protein [Anaeromyxobacter sp.]